MIITANINIGDTVYFESRRSLGKGEVISKSATGVIRVKIDNTERHISFKSSGLERGNHNLDTSFLIDADQYLISLARRREIALMREIATKATTLAGMVNGRNNIDEISAKFGELEILMKRLTDAR